MISVNKPKGPTSKGHKPTSPARIAAEASKKMAKMVTKGRAPKAK